jgi:hypothetical protein
MSNSVEENQYEKHNIVAVKNVKGDASVNSGKVSSMSGFLSEKEILVPNTELAIMPQQSAMAQYQ